MKKVLVALLILMIIMPMVACQASSAAETNAASAVFEGAAEGKNGTIKVAITIEQNEITKIEVLENNESEFTADCFAEMLEKIQAANSTAVDVVAGATITSEAILDAVSAAVEKSGVQLTKKEVAEPEKVVAEVAGVPLAAGTYEGEDKGFEGPIKVSVTLSDTKIEGVEILSHNETEGHGDKAMETVIQSILDAQRLDVDVVTGASNSSNGVIAAITKALQNAGTDVEGIGGTFIEEVEVLPACQRLTDITPEDAAEGHKVYYFETDGSTCTTGFRVELDGTKVMGVTFDGDPCIGNSEGIKSLIYGMEMDDVIADFEGIMCPGAGDVSSCPDQLAKGLKQIYKIQNGIECENHSEVVTEEAAQCSGECETCPFNS